MARNNPNPDNNETYEDELLKEMGVGDPEDDENLEDVDGEESNEDDDLTNDNEDLATESVDDDRTKTVDDKEIEELTKEYKADNKKNLVDSKGKVVARAGTERQAFERTKAALKQKHQESQALVARLNEVSQAGRILLDRYNQLKEDSGYGDKIGLTKDENKEALDVFARMKHDAKGGLKYILTKMTMAGHDLSDLGVSGPLDAQAIADAAIKRHIAATKPVEETHEQKAEKAAKQFLDDFPNARNKIPIIAEAKQRWPQYSLHEIWVRLSIHEAIEAFKAKSGTRRPEQRGDQKRLPNNAPPAKHNNPRESKRRVLDDRPRDPTKSYSEIGKDLLREIREIEGN